MGDWDWLLVYDYVKLTVIHLLIKRSTKQENSNRISLL